MAPRTVQAVSVVLGTAGTCRLVERPEMLAQTELCLHNTIAILKTSRELILLLTNISDRPVNLPKNYAIGLAERYAGLTYEITEEDEPADMGADPLCTAGQTEDHPPKEAPSVPVEEQAPKTNGRPQDRVPPDQQPPELSPSPRVAY